MHAEAWQFLSKAAGYVNARPGMDVLEFGAHDVNGSPRALFPHTRYVGVDPWPGEGVNLVGRAQDFDGSEEFDVVITAEAMEHDPDARGQIDAAWRALKPGGYLILTAASEPRAPHRCDGFQGEMNGEYYGNIDIIELIGWLKDWQVIMVQHDKQHGDVYALAAKPCA